MRNLILNVSDYVSRWAVGGVSRPGQSLALARSTPHREDTVREHLLAALSACSDKVTLGLRLSTTKKSCVRLSPTNLCPPANFCSKPRPRSTQPLKAVCKKFRLPDGLDADHPALSVHARHPPPPTPSPVLASSRSWCSRDLFAQRRYFVSELGRSPFSVEDEVIVAGLVASTTSHVKSVWVSIGWQLDE